MKQKHEKSEKELSENSVNVIISKYKPIVEQIAVISNPRIKKKSAALICVDLVNDGSDDEGFFKKVLKFDISMIQSIEPNVIRLIKAARDKKIPIIGVQAVYDFEYIPASMKERFEAMEIKGGLAPKGAWGSRIISKITSLGLDLVLAKSHYSAFSPGYTFAYKPGNTELEKYMEMPAEKDTELRAAGAMIMQDYFKESCQLPPIKEIVEKKLSEGGVVSLDTYLRAGGIDTLIIVGASTHVCVDSTVAGASERGYKVIMPIDAVASEDHEKHFVYLSNHGIFKAQLTTTKALLEVMSNM